MTRRPLPSTGSEWASFPRFLGTIRTLRLPAALPASLLGLWIGGTACAPVDSLPAGTGAAPVGLGLVSRSPPASSSGNGRASHVPGRPFCVFALLSDPGRTLASGHQRCSGAAPATSRTRAPAKDTNFEARSHGFNTRCLRFAAPVTRRPRKTRFRLLARLCRMGLVTHRVSVKVSSSEYYPPFPDFVARRCVRTGRADGQAGAVLAVQAGPP